MSSLKAVVLSALICTSIAKSQSAFVDHSTESMVVQESRVNIRRQVIAASLAGLVVVSASIWIYLGRRTPNPVVHYRRES